MQKGLLTLFVVVVQFPSFRYPLPLTEPMASLKWHLYMYVYIFGFDRRRRCFERSAAGLSGCIRGGRRQHWSCTKLCSWCSIGARRVLITMSVDLHFDSTERVEAPDCEQDSSGIVSYDGKRFREKKDKGLVKDVFDKSAMSYLEGTSAIGHVRYPTAGGDTGADAQPFFVNSPLGIYLIHNGNLTNAEPLRDLVEHQSDLSFFRHLRTESDSEVLLNVFADNVCFPPFSLSLFFFFWLCAHGSSRHFISFRFPPWCADTQGAQGGVHFIRARVDLPCSEANDERPARGILRDNAYQSGKGIIICK